MRDNDGQHRAKIEDLRRQALDRLQKRHGALTGLPADKIEELLHELEIHQVELEVQNEELRRTESALADALERYRDLYDHAPVSYLTIASDGRVLQANQAAARLCGRDRDEIEGAPVTDIIVREDRQKVLQFLRAAGSGITQEGEFRVVRPRGFRWVHAGASWLSRREASGFRLMLIDISARVQAEEALRESEMRFRLASDAGAALVYEIDLDGERTMIAYGLERVTGHRPPGDGKLTGHWWASRIHPDDRRLYDEHLSRLGADHEPHATVYRLRRGNGSWITVEDRAQLSPDTSTVALPRAVGTIVDITERREAERALLEADRRKDEFLATLAHELRNPLAPIRNAVQILQVAGSQGADSPWARGVIERQTAQMARLVDDLLDVSRITRGKIELRKQRVALGSVLNDAVEAARPLIEQSGHALLVELPEDPVILDADPTRLAQVFSNLLNNAAKFTGHGGKIGITAAMEGPMVAVLVTDTGAGIPPEVLPHVFELFAQGDQSTERVAGGLGIGLTLVKRMVELHGGRVEASSEGRGRGSQFTVHLPVADATVTWKKIGSREPAAPSQPPGHRILVVDDNLDSAESMAAFLRLGPYDVQTAHDGLAALDAVKSFQPDVVLLDIGLPGRNGYDVATEVRETYGSKMLLIAMTGWGQEEDRHRSKNAGFDHHLTKPVDLDQLNRLLGHHPSRSG